MTPLLLATALLSLAAEPEPAAPDAARSEAEQRYTKGIELTKDARWNAALAEFQTARVIVETALPADERARILPAILYEIGLAAEHVASKASVAVLAYERYLAEPPLNPNPKALAHARAVVAKLSDTVGRVRILGPAGGQVFVDNEPVGVLPLPAALIVNRGVHEVSIATDGWLPNPVRLELIVPGGGQTQLDARPYLRKPEIQRGILVIRSAVPAIAVLIDGEVSDAVSEVAAGVHKVEVTRPGYTPSRTAARVEPGKETTVTVDLVPLEVLPAALAGSMRIVPNVDDAVATLDGKPAPGLVGDGVSIPIGPHDITVRAASGDFDEYNGRIVVRGGDNPALPIALLPLAPPVRDGAPNMDLVAGTPAPAGPSAGKIALIVGGGAAFVAGAVLAGLAFDASGEVDSLIEARAPVDDVSDKERSGRDLAIAADVLVSTGLVTGLIGLIFVD